MTFMSWVVDNIQEFKDALMSENWATTENLGKFWLTFPNLERRLYKRIEDRSFINQDTSGDFEWTATMYNLNKENDGLLDACRPLKEYMTLVQYIRSNMGNGMTVERAVDEAVKRCIAENVMKAFLIKHRAEVCSMCITEYNEKTFVDGIRAEGIAEGMAEGSLEKGLAVYYNLLKRGFTKEDALAIADIPESAVKDDTQKDRSE